MVDIIAVIDALVADEPVLSSNDLFAASFDRIVGVEGHSFLCDCGRKIEETVQIGSTSTSRRGFEDELYFLLYDYDWDTIRCDDEYPRHHPIGLEHQSIGCWICEGHHGLNRVGLCSHCDEMMKKEVDRFNVYGLRTFPGGYEATSYVVYGD